MEEAFDVAIIGAGPGGYTCAIKAAQLGLKVACVDERDFLGGTCLNVGCIPSKALLHISDYFEHTQLFADLGIVLKTKPSIDLDLVMAFKDRAIAGNANGVEFLFKKNKVSRFKGCGYIESIGHVRVDGADGEKTFIRTKNIVIATGSTPTQLPNAQIDEKSILTSTGALCLPFVPEKLLVVGGGVIGLELGVVWQRFGAKVTIVEYGSHILSSVDSDVVKIVEKFLEKRDIEILHCTKTVGIEKNKKNGVRVALQSLKDGKETERCVDVALVCIGRTPYTKGLGLENLSVQLTEKKQIKVDNLCQTSVPGVFALGDVTNGPMLAHRAMDEGVALAERLVGRWGEVNYSVIPSVVYTNPEIATVGLMEYQLVEMGVKYKVGKFPLTANGRAKVNQETDGLVKIMACKETDRILGACIVASNAGEMVHEIVAVMELGGSSEDIGRMCHAHPTLSEAIKESALAAYDKALHM